ncbi:MAG: tetraacyldisaccharide 4'-kinase [Flavobacteriaceae bacterium]|nr:tetraacyldisaccharide 4'-kinase [Flavobacteriaceae bacterium]|tara:strand:- start:49 stop:1047 length:999 start_codon:yes stop_codon:yes gene_type:complete
MKLIKKIFLSIISIPFSIVTLIRNSLYDIGLYKSSEFNIPIISVGNLVLGGSGKTPTIEYLIRLLSKNYKIAVLSRGYGRKSNGFIIADSNSDANLIGDEPMQYFRKFKDIVVSVDSDRTRAINKLINLNLKLEIILLDDAYQHRKVKPKTSILLTEYSKIYSEDYIFPLGNLRESVANAKRADIILVTKCDKNINQNHKIKTIQKLNANKNQKIYFSSIKYSNMVYSKEDKKSIDDLKNRKFILVTGIANSSNMVNYLKDKGYDFNHLSFNDHHNYSDSDISDINANELVITTEKDYVKLYSRVTTKLFYLPIEFIIDNEEEFNNQILYSI